MNVLKNRDKGIKRIPLKIELTTLIIPAACIIFTEYFVSIVENNHRPQLKDKHQLMRPKQEAGTYRNTEDRH